MNEQIFRKKSLERIESPENLNDYIKVTRPSVWLLLVAIIIFFLGGVVWATFGHIDTSIPADATISNGILSMTITDKQNLPDGYNGEDARLVISGKSYNIPLHINQDGTFTSVSKVPENIDDGSYSIDVIVESVSPIIYIINN